jgi:hypothetical protein
MGFAEEASAKTTRQIFVKTRETISLGVVERHHGHVNGQTQPRLCFAPDQQLLIFITIFTGCKNMQLEGRLILVGDEICLEACISALVVHWWRTTTSSRRPSTPCNQLEAALNALPSDDADDSVKRERKRL